MPHITKTKALVILAVLIILGTVVRFWQLEQYMHYELDQARDFRVIHAAIERGPSELPLQGPKAAGKVHVEDGILDDDRNTTTLRLGPLFYYIEYLSARIFGDTPVGHITLITLLSVLTIPLFYLFVREYFTRYLALTLTSVLTLSLYFVVYSRFGWNPNLIPFFSLGVAYALLRATRSTSHSGPWLLLAAVSFAFLSNMHFLALTIVPVICVIYLLITRPRIALGWWITAISAFLLLNTPLILNDVMTGGENTKAFIASLTEDRSASHTLPEKLTKNIREHVLYATTVTTSYQRADFPLWRSEGGVMCDGKCVSYGGIVGIVVGLLIGFALVQYTLSLYGAQSDKHRHFLILVALWLGVTFIFFTPLAFDFAPRFFLLQAPFFVVLLGFVLHGLYRTRRTALEHLSVAIIVTLAVLNTWALIAYFWERTTAPEDVAFELHYTDRILGEKTRVTLGQMESIVADLVADSNVSGAPILLEAQAEYKRALWERITHHPEYDHVGVADLRTPYVVGQHYLILRTQSDPEKHLSKYSELFTVSSEKKYGTLTLYRLTPRSYRAKKGSPQFIEQNSPRFSRSAQVRYLWRQFTEGCRYDYTSRRCE